MSNDGRGRGPLYDASLRWDDDAELWLATDDDDDERYEPWFLAAQDEFDRADQYDAMRRHWLAWDWLDFYAPDPSELAARRARVRWQRKRRERRKGKR